MKTEVKEFFEDSKKKILFMDSNPSINVMSDWKSIRNPLRIFVNYVIISLAKFSPFRYLTNWLLRIIGVKIGKNVGFSQANIDILCPNLLEIRQGAAIGWRANILCHEFVPGKIRLGRVVIGKNALVGAFTTIRSGVTIGDNSIISMNSFVNKDVPKNEMWGGVPAKRIKKLK